MSISYVDDLSDGQGIFIFAKILGRWKGSLYKLVWIDLVLYISAYYILNLTYRFAMNESQQKVFEDIVLFCEKTKGDIPISFLLGFFVAGIIGRWYKMYMHIPWMNDVALHIATTVNGKDEIASRKVRLTIMRYLNMSWILMMQRVSDQIAFRFSVPENDAPEEKPVQPLRRRTASAKYKIVRNLNQPWCIDSTQSDCLKGPSSTLNKPGHLTPTFHSCSVLAIDEARQTMLGASQDNQSTPVSTSIDPDIKYDNIYTDAFQATEDRKLKAELLAFNNDLQVKRTFGFMITNAEVDAFLRIAGERFERTKAKYNPEYWIPIQWAQRLTLKALHNGYIFDPKGAYHLIERIASLRQEMQDLQIFSSIMIPLVYTQVVIIAVYSYFLCQIFACQFVKSHGPGAEDRIDLYVPIFNIFSFMFLMGWLKVALCVMNPFGDDDEDFQTSSILDYNLEVSYRSVTMDSRGFPSCMSFPLAQPKTDENQVRELDQFLESVDESIHRNVQHQAEANVSNLEVRPTLLKRFGNYICCRKEGKRASRLIVTNVADENRFHRTGNINNPSQHKWNFL